MTYRPATGFAIGFGVLLVALAGGLQLWPGFEPTRQVLHDGFGPEGDANSRSVRLLQQLGLPSEAAGWTTHAGDAPSSKAVADEFLSPGQWLVSIAIPEESLHDPEQGILAHPAGRGRAWERVAWVSLYDGRRLVAATRAGLRVHGGASRGEVGREAFRVVFRPSYGLPHMPAGGPLGTPERPPDRFVIRRSSTMPQAQPIAFEIARRIGAVAPAAVVARFVLNGSLRPEPYELTEQVSRDGWGRSYFGHDEFRFHQYKSEAAPSDDGPYDAMSESLWQAPRPLLMTQAAGRIDTDNFVRHILTIMYCGTHDWAQGGAVLNLRSPRPRWFWVLWDLDVSFRGPGAEPWKRPSIGHFLAPHPIERTDLRARLFRRLLREDPSFVRHFTGVVSETLNHALTAAYLQDLVRRHEQLSVQSVPFGGFDLGAFFAHRGDEVFDAVATAIDRPRPHVVEIRAPGDVRLRVDGHEYGPYYSGRYFEGQTLTVQALGSDGTLRGRWRVNGLATIDRELKIVVDREAVILVEG